MKRLHVIYGRNYAYVRGYQARELLVAVGDRKPVWAPLRAAWCTSRHRGLDAIDLAESRRYSVTTDEEEQMPAPAVEVAPLDVDLQESLW